LEENASALWCIDEWSGILGELKSQEYYQAMRTTLLTLQEHGGIWKQRLSRLSVQVEEPALSILGGIQSRIFTQEMLTEKFEREKTLITEQSKIRPRPANELRLEERYEVMNRMVAHLFGRGDDPSEPTPLEIEYFHRYFEIERMFVYTHPSWWKPRYALAKTGFGRKAYEITADSDPAPMGSSLGWLIQIDGDTRRNEFINSPWLRVCLPIRPGREQEAIDWLRTHIEGDFGFDTQTGPLKDLIEELEAFREKEGALGVDGPNYVTVDSSVGAPEDPQKPEGVFPIIDEFDVTVPTDGFVYDELELSG